MVAALAPTQEPGREDHSLQNFRRYLARSPYHERVFDQLLRRLRSTGEFESFVTQLEAEASTFEGQVLLARLRAEAGQVPAAIEALDAALAEAGAVGDPLGLRLRAHLHARAGDRAASLTDLKAAVEKATEDSELLRGLLEELSAGLIVAGDRGAARAALERLATVDPEDPGARLDVGERLAQAGFHRAAARQFERAVDLAGQDSARRCEALAALGRQQERLGEEERAIESYLDALPRLRRGHWLADDLRGRVLELFERGGRIEDLVELQRSAVAATPGEAGAREFLALALERAGHAGEALEVLAEAVARFPDDAALSKERREVARRSGDHEAEVAELQRLLSARPGDIELAFTLGEALAAAGRLEAAHGRWSALLADRGRDASMARRVAERWVAYGEVERARGLFERARDIAPDEVDRYLDLARFLVRHGQAPAAIAVLSEAEARFVDAPRALVAVGEAWEVLLRLEDSARCWRAALVLIPEDAQLRYRLGKLLVELDQLDEGREHLRGTAGRARVWELAQLAAKHFASTLGDGELARAALRSEGERLERDPADRGAHLVSIALHRLAGEPQRVERAWRALILARPQDPQARVELARWLGDSKRFEEGIVELRAALPLLPGRAREILLAQADLHGELAQLDLASRCLDQVVDLEADDPEALADVARRFKDLGLLGRAAATWRRVLRLRPDDGAAHLAAARVALGLSKTEPALAHLRAAWRQRPFRGEATTGLVDVLSGTGRIDQEVATLDARVRADPFDREAVLLAADVLAGAERFGQALARIDRSLALRPYAVELLERKGKLLLSLGRSAEALEVYGLLRAGGGGAARSVTLDMVAAHLEAGLTDSAVQLAAELNAPLEALSLFKGAALGQARIQLLQAVVARPAPPPEAFERLARECEDADRWSEALAALEGLRGVSVTGWNITRRIGALRQATGDLDGARVEAARLLSEADDPEVARVFYEEIGALPTFYRLTTEAVLATPADEAKVRATLEFLYGARQYSVMISLARRLRIAVVEQRAFPAGYTLAGWARWLHGAELGVYGIFRVEVVGARIGVLREREASGHLPEKLAVDLLQLLSMQHASVGEERELVARLVARYPRSPALLHAAAEFWLQGGNAKEAASLWRRTAEVLSEPQHDREVHATRDRLRAAHEGAVRSRLSADAALAQAQVLRAVELSYDAYDRPVWWRPVFPDPFDVQLGWALAEARGGDTASANRRCEDAGEGLGPDELSRRARLASTLAMARLDPAAGQQLVDLTGRVAAVRSHPEFSGTVASLHAAQFLARVLSAWERARRQAEAYVLVRQAGYGAEAREFLFRYRFYGRVQAFTRLGFEEAKVALRGAREGLDRERALRRLHDSAVMHAEALRAGGGTGDYDQRQQRVEAVWAELEALNPGDLAVLWRQAGRADWTGDWAASALRHTQGALARLDLADWEPERRAIWSDQLLTELVPPRDRAGRAAGWQELRFQALGGDLTDPSAHWLGALHASLMLNDGLNAVESLEQLLAGGCGPLDPAAIEGVLAVEDYLDQADRARAALDRWRETRAGSR
jgi:tetratricopeptide (TPR) repeat protein